jgi:hypothetical protein
MKLTVKNAPPIDRGKLRVRLNEKDKPNGINWYDYIEITANSKSIVGKLHGDKIPEIKKRK